MGKTREESFGEAIYFWIIWRLENIIGERWIVFMVSDNWTEIYERYEKLF